MSGALRFGWLGEGRRTALHALLVHDASAWSRDWWMSHSAASIDVFPLDSWREELNPSDAIVWSLGEGELKIEAHLGSAALGAHLAGASRSQPSALADAVGRKAIADFVERLAKRIGCKAIGPKSVDPHEGMYQAKWGGYMATVSLGAHHFSLAMDRKLADLLVPSRHSGLPALTPRTQAIAGAHVSLEVFLPFGTTALSNLDDLKVGEVLVADAPLNAPMEVRLDGTEIIALAVLGQSGHSHTVTLTAIS